MITDSLYILCETCLNILQESENSLHVQEFKIKAIHQLYSLGGSETVVASVIGEPRHRLRVVDQNGGYVGHIVSLTVCTVKSLLLQTLY